MFIVRDTFQCKPGMAKEIVKKFISASKYMEMEGIHGVKILTDVVSNYWTVVLELEVENLSSWEKSEGFTSKPEVREIFKDYMTMVEGGRREVFKIAYEFNANPNKEGYKMQENIQA